MRVAIFSDIHGNAVALEAVLADVRALAPQVIVCGGDLAFGGPEPEACVDRIKEVGIPCVRGNTDQWLGGSGREPGNAVGEWSRGLVVNAGSVGAPYDGDPRASYAVLERGASTWSADLRRVPYDIDRAVRTFPADHPARAQWADAIRSARRPF